MFDKMRALAAAACLILGASGVASAQTAGGARANAGAASGHFNTGSSTIHHPGTASPPPATPVQPAIPAPVPPPPVARPH